MKTLLFASAAGLAVALPLATQAADQGAQDLLPPTYITYQLVGEGYDLRGLEYEHGAYEARVRGQDGQLSRVSVDPRTGQVLPSGRDERRRAESAAATKVNAADAIQAVAMEGYWDIVRLRHRDGAWQVTARNDAGSLSKFSVDSQTGAVAPAAR